jgi:4-amino-4-deoxy-L-arabinose transferase-like glycosyltransferase
MRQILKNKKYGITALLLVLFFIFLAFFSEEDFHWKDLKYTGNAITSDELSHISSGYYYLKTGRYFINPEHPPIVKDIAGLPLLFLNPVLPEISDNLNLNSEFTRWNYPFESYIMPKSLEVGNSQWDWGRLFLFNPDNNPDYITFWSRFSVILFNAILLLILYFVLSKIWGKRASLIGLFLIVSSQFVIAMSSLVIMDFTSSILIMIAAACFTIYLKNYAENKKIISWFLLSVLFTSLALLTKFSVVILFPALFSGGLFFIIFVKKSWKEIFRYIVRFSLFTILVAFAISVFYYLHVRNMSQDEMIMQVVQTYPQELPYFGAEILASLVLGSPITRGLVEYIIGIIMVGGRMSSALQHTYFMGGVYDSEGAGPLYFPILFLTKLSLGTLALIFMSFFLALWKFISSKVDLKNRFIEFIKNPLSLLIFIFSYIYLVTTFSSNLQIGLRHIMPVIVAIILLAARGIDLNWDFRLFHILRTKLVFYIFALAVIISVLASFPYYLSYYNVFAGGTKNGYRIATDSNYDWGGQDVKRLAKWAKDNNINKIYAHIFTNVPLQYYLGTGYEPYNIEWGWIPTEAYIAVSIFEYQNNVYNNKLPDSKNYNKIKDYFYKRVGTTMLIFKTPAEIK